MEGSLKLPEKINPNLRPFLLSGLFFLLNNLPLETINLMKARLAVLFFAAFAVSVFLIQKGVITQIQSYHQFADTRSFLGIPNALDVLTNTGFILVGMLGLILVYKKKDDLPSFSSWKWFFLSILLIAPGSAYYHWSPDDQSLVWDRLPMSLGFMALYVALLTEHIHLKSEKFLPLALTIGILSVLTWIITKDLRFYFIVQFSSFATIPIILILFRSMFTHKLYYAGALLCYGMAKWTEAKDGEIFSSTNGMISGHSLKHILAALGLLLLWRMIGVRKLTKV